MDARAGLINQARQFNFLGALLMVIPYAVLAKLLAAHPSYFSGHAPGMALYLGSVCDGFCIDFYLNYVGALLPIAVGAAGLAVARPFLARSPAGARYLLLITVAFSMAVLGLSHVTEIRQLGLRTAVDPYAFLVCAVLVGGSIALCSKGLVAAGSRRLSVEALKAALFTYSLFTLLLLWADLVDVPYAFLALRFSGEVPNTIGGAGTGDGLFVIPISMSVGFLVAYLLGQVG